MHNRALPAAIGNLFSLPHDPLFWRVAASFNRYIPLREAEERTLWILTFIYFHCILV